MNLHRRAELVRAMDVIGSCLNDDDHAYMWLSVGVCDGDIVPETTDEDLKSYCEDDSFADLMGSFLDVICESVKQGGISGCLYCDNVLSRYER